MMSLIIPEDDVVPSKILSYNRANRAVAILCNHQVCVCVCVCVCVLSIIVPLTSLSISLSLSLPLSSSLSQRAPPKTFDQQLSNLQAKVTAKEEAILEVKAEVKALRREAKASKDPKVTKSVCLQCVCTMLCDV